MRRKQHNRKNFTKISLIILLALFLSIFQPVIDVSAQDNELSILLTNENDEIINSITENTYIKVSVYNSSNTLLSNVTIVFDETEYEIKDDDNFEKTILAPEVDIDTFFTINASKEGYTNISQSIEVLDYPLLFIILESYVLDSGETFLVKITKDNADGEAVKDVTVAIQNIIGTETLTDSNGRTYLTAPKDQDKITIVASKSGFVSNTEQIKINPPSDFLGEIINSRYFLIFIAIFILIIAVIVVTFRQRRYDYYRINKPDNKPVPSDPSTEEKDTGPDDSSSIRLQSGKNSKVEEIRIIQSRTEKDVVPVKKREEEEDTVDEESKKDSDWFEGTNEVRYEIDRITGEIDEDGEGKWFEGVEDIREKIDEKMKKKDKKDKKDKE